MSISVGVLGAGGAGLISAHTLLRDGFNVQILTRDPSPGGVWATNRVYDGVTINSIHGEWRFSCLPPQTESKDTKQRLTGSDMNRYFETFSKKFLSGKIVFDVEICNVSRHPDGGWAILVKNNLTGEDQSFHYDKIVVCTGGCSEPSIPESLASTVHLFSGPVCHSSQFQSRREAILKASEEDEKPKNIVVVGGGKSAQDIACILKNLGRKVTMVFQSSDAFVASPKPLPKAIQSSRLMALISPNIELRTPAERFLHKTRIGGAIVRKLWNDTAETSYNQLKIPKDSPLRNPVHHFWNPQINFEGVGSPNGYHAHAVSGAIRTITPGRVQAFGSDGDSVVLNDGSIVKADAVVLATGFKSSWKNIFDEATMDDIGLTPQKPSAASILATEECWNYTSFKTKNVPAPHPRNQEGFSPIYRGVVPAKNLFKRDFAINGAIAATNNGYIWETISHWISSYFLGDPFLSLPPTIEDAVSNAERCAAWLRRRYPHVNLWDNPSVSTNFVLLTWPQTCDEFLEDMSLPSRRSGGNWLTWPFKVIDIKEIENLREERIAKRLAITGPSKAQ